MKRYNLPLAAVVVMLASAVALLSLIPAHGTPKATANQVGDVEFSLGIVPAANVDCVPASKPDKCQVEPGTSFTLVASMNSVSGTYAGWNVSVVHLGLVSKDVRMLAPEAEFSLLLGPSGSGTEEFLAAGQTGTFPPLPKSTYTGPLVQADFNCPVDPESFKLSMPVPATFAVDQFTDHIPITTVQQGAEKVADTLAINCAAAEPVKLPFPGDTDGDGCADTRENLPKSQFSDGGGRDWLDPYDYYDVSIPRDGVIDLPNDILGVIRHYAPMGFEPYDVNYDRGPSAGPNPWNATAPDGVIDLANDILRVIRQYQHNCLP